MQRSILAHGESYEYDNAARSMVCKHYLNPSSRRTKKHCMIIVRESEKKTKTVLECRFSISPNRPTRVAEKFVEINGSDRVTTVASGYTTDESFRQRIPWYTRTGRIWFRNRFAGRRRSPRLDCRRPSSKFRPTCR